ncbi:MAG: zinc-ribbon domain-containing protein [Methyloligellaceae bacterium]
MLITCSECSEKISDKARACPKCGAPNRKNRFSAGGFFGKAVLCVLVLIALALAIAPLTKPGHARFETMVHNHLVQKLAQQNLSREDNFVKRFIKIGCKLSTHECARIIRERMQVEFQDHLFARSATITTDKGTNKCLGIYGNWWCTPPNKKQSLPE